MIYRIIGNNDEIATQHAGIELLLSTNFLAQDENQFHFFLAVNEVNIPMMNLKS